MSALSIAFIVFLFVVAGGVFGIVLRRALPDRHLSEDSKDMVRLGTGLVGTIAALVLGLLIASAKTSFDTRGAQINQLTANVILLDNFLAKYGPDSHDARQSLRQAVESMAKRVWDESETRTKSVHAFTTTAAFEEFYEKLDRLAADSEAKRSLKDRAVQAATELAKTRFLLFAEAETDRSIPTPFLIVLTFWLTIIFISFSLFAQPNAIVIVCLVLFAISASASIYLVLELAQPFDGLMQISSEPLRKALEPMSK